MAFGRPGPEVAQAGIKVVHFGHLGGLGQKLFKMVPKSTTRSNRGLAMAPIRNGYNPSCQNWYHPFVIALIRNGCQPSCQNWYHPFVMATAPMAPSSEFGTTIFDFPGVPKTIPWSDMFGQKHRLLGCCCGPSPGCYH